MIPSRILFLAGAFATHAVVGYALAAAFTDADPRVGAVLALVPDLDFVIPPVAGVPFVHRSVTHTPAFALVVVAAVAARYRRETAVAAALAIGSHLAIDSLSPAGIRWLFPLEAASPSPGLSVHGPVVTGVLWLFALGLLAWRGGLADRVSIGAR